MRNLFVFDLDGTLADCSTRLPLIRTKPKNYKEFDARCDKDTPIGWVIKLNHYVATSNLLENIIILTGRNEATREKTIVWLDRNLVFYSKLIMRPAGNNEPDNILKPKLLKEFIQGTDFDVQFIVEDRARVCEAYRQAGFNVLQCAKGDY